MEICSFGQIPIKASCLHLNLNGRRSARRLYKAMSIISYDYYMETLKDHFDTSKRGGRLYDGDVCLLKNVTLCHAILKVETEDYYAWVLSKYKVLPQTNQNLGNACKWN